MKWHTTIRSADCVGSATGSPLVSVHAPLTARSEDFSQPRRFVKRGRVSPARVRLETWTCRTGLRYLLSNCPTADSRGRSAPKKTSHRLESFWHDRPPRPLSALLTDNEASFAKQTRVMRNGGLAPFERL